MASTVTADTAIVTDGYEQPFSVMVHTRIGGRDERAEEQAVLQRHWQSLVVSERKQQPSGCMETEQRLAED